MLLSRIQKQIPKRLSHYTNIEALKSILSDEEGKGICFWTFSNKYKNDDQEIKMGEYMLKCILNSTSFPECSLLHRFGGYEYSASVSFMEGEVNQHMLNEYGCYRLEFDLRQLGIGNITDGIIDCEYVAYNDLREYADEYCDLICKTYNTFKVLQKKYGKTSALPFNNLVLFIMMENDVIRKVFGLKEEKWREEREWRKVIALKDGFLWYNGRPYTKYYLDKNMLTGITVFCARDALYAAQYDADEIRKYISDRGYKAKVHIEVFEQLR